MEIKNALSRFFTAIGDTLYGPMCISCRKTLVSRASALCEKCADIYSLEADMRCALCVQPFSHCECTVKCHGEDRHVLYRVAYQSSYRVADRVLLFAKDHDDEACFDFIGGELVKVLNERYEVVTGEPIGSNTIITYLTRRQRSLMRGNHDQAREMALVVAEKLDIDIYHFFENFGTRAQKTLNSLERAANAKTSFVFCGNPTDVIGKTVIMVDDLVTTGAGMVACGNILLSLGAKNIVILAYCRATPVFEMVKRRRFHEISI